jgi:multidrug efflux pump
MYLSMWSNIAPRAQLYDLTDSIVGQKISQVKGVGQVVIGGSSKPAVRVDVNPMALARYGIGLEDVRAALQSANVNSPKGLIEDPQNRWVLSATDQLFDAYHYLPLIVAYRGGAPVRLSDVATVSDGIEDIRNAGFAERQHH